jgi:hypothetical protein
MSQEQNKTISGSVYDTYTPASQEYKENRMPRVGQTVEFEDGRKFVFASTLVDVGAGQLVGAAGYTTAVVSATPAAAGQRQIILTKAGAVANEYAGGMLTVDEIGGTTYKIKSNSASGTANAVTVTVYDPLVTALGAGDAILLVPSRSVNVVIGTADNDTVGAALVTTTAATDATTAYQWFQYEGLGVSITTIASGTAVMAVAGGAILAQTAANPIVGKAVADDDNNLSVVYWTIEGGC